MGSIRLEALADHHLPTVLAACLDWQELSQYGAPYWRPRSIAELRRKITAASGPQVASEYTFVIAAENEEASNPRTDTTSAQINVNANANAGNPTLIGECSIHGIDWRNRIAQVGVCIWHPDDRHHGYGQAAAQQVAAWAFGYLGLFTLEAWIVEDNQSSLRLFEKLGFTYEGTLRGRYLQGGISKAVVVLARTVGDAAE
ncbi:MAG: GNAT family N-acetyltransferase [Ancrocorticia sp.]